MWRALVRLGQEHWAGFTGEPIHVWGRSHGCIRTRGVGSRGSSIPACRIATHGIGVVVVAGVGNFAVWVVVITYEVAVHLL